MEINITKFFNNAAPMDYSASIAEIGDDAGPATWRAANEDSEDYFMLDTDEKRDAFRNHVKGFGAWSDDEIAVWSDIELNALFIQMVSGDMREGGLDERPVDWEAYKEQCEQGNCSGNIYGGSLCIPEFADSVFYSLN